MHGYLSLDIICSSKSVDFLEQTVCFSEQITSADKYPCILSYKMEAIVHLYSHGKVAAKELAKFSEITQSGCLCM